MFYLADINLKESRLLFMQLKAYISFTQFTLALGVSLLLSACVQQWEIDIPRFAQKSTSMKIPKATIKTVNRSFYGHFMAGDWYDKGAEAEYGEINAYIQIPEKLQMSVDLQRHYIQSSICPKSDKIDLWNSLKEVKLTVHIYTSSKNYSVWAQCENPWLQKT
jgi:hypothetical protein